MAFSSAVNTHFDFRTQYTAGYMLRTGNGQNLYNYDETKKFQNELVSPAEVALPFDHLAYESLLYVPFSIFKYQTAYLLFFALNLGFLVWSFRLLEPYILNLRDVWQYLPIAIFACFLPVTMALIEGQDSIILLTIISGVAVKLAKHEDVSAGALLGLGCFKFQYVIPVILLFLIWRRWHFLFGFIAVASLVTGISLWITGVDGFVSYLQNLGKISAHFSSQNGIKLGVRPELMPNLRGVVFAIAGSHSLLANAFTVILSAVVFFWAARMRPSFPLAMMVAILVSYHETISDASLLIFPVGIAAVSALKSVSKSSKLVATCCAMIFVLPGPLMFGAVYFYLLTIPSLVLFFLGTEALVTTIAERHVPAA